ncbi:hypothetical protein BHE74_00012416 [Ensete ventricosum]|uniref:Uncharacterized protein n=1 Tax=Ensete ventricosum TaxID=4639 RepID=A0A426YM26_ENSVE|nr:hypothetical protein B296_00026648 [Ensete ventricosum]RWV82387.1 hypothetical protein GW17_00056115 [Ensete ventricosum]RWW79303.1 hypothetical protein BHE74_00012416 [Ensete ventricosum]
MLTETNGSGAGGLSRLGHVKPEDVLWCLRSRTIPGERNTWWRSETVGGAMNPRGWFGRNGQGSVTGRVGCRGQRDSTEENGDLDANSDRERSGAPSRFRFELRRNFGDPMAI